MLEVAAHPGARATCDLGEDSIACVDQVEVDLRGRDVRVVAGQRLGEAKHLAEAFDTGEPASDERDREASLAFGPGWKAGRLVEGCQHGVADGDRFLDAFQPDGGVSDTRHREDTCHRSGGDDDLVVGERGRGAVGEADVHRPCRVVDLESARPLTMTV